MARAEALMGGKPAFGNWATKGVISDHAFARNDLAIMKEFKDDVSFKVTVEPTAPHKVNQGVVGPMGAAKGGAVQVEFLGNKNLKVVGQPQARYILKMWGSSLYRNARFKRSGLQQALT